jgi:hypothetical protein
MFIYNARINCERFAMPAARGLAGDIAEVLGRSGSEGWVFTRYLQDAGVFKKGRGGRGGSGSPRATIEHAEILTLAIALGIPAKQAIAEALALRTLPIENSTRLFI